jgi:hypothetical protein
MNCWAFGFPFERSGRRSQPARLDRVVGRERVLALVG